MDKINFDAVVDVPEEFFDLKDDYKEIKSFLDKKEGGYFYDKDVADKDIAFIKLIDKYYFLYNN